MENDAFGESSCCMRSRAEDERKFMEISFGEEQDIRDG